MKKIIVMMVILLVPSFLVASVVYTRPSGDAAGQEDILARTERLSREHAEREEVRRREGERRRGDRGPYARMHLAARGRHGDFVEPIDDADVEVNHITRRILAKAEEEQRINRPFMLVKIEFRRRVSALKEKLESFKQRHSVQEHEITQLRDEVAELQGHKGIGIEFGEKGGRGGPMNMLKLPLAYAPWRAFVSPEIKKQQLHMLKGLAVRIDLIEDAFRHKQEDPNLVLSDAIALLTIEKNLRGRGVSGKRAAAAHRLIRDILPLHHDTRMQVARHGRVMDEVRERDGSTYPRVYAEEDRVESGYAREVRVPPFKIGHSGDGAGRRSDYRDGSTTDRSRGSRSDRLPDIKSRSRPSSAPSHRRGHGRRRERHHAADHPPLRPQRSVDQAWK